MRCNASPTTSIAREPVAGAANDPARIARGTVEALLFREVLAPLAAGLGPVGDTALERVADELFLPRSERT